MDNNFNEEAVRRAYTKRAKNDRVPLWDVTPEQIHRDLYAERAVGGITLHFVVRIKKDMLKDLVAEAIEKQVLETPRDLTDINPSLIQESVFGKYRYRFTLSQGREVSTGTFVRDVQYDMIVAEGLAQRKAARRA